jgi:chemotaxis protein CheD
VQPVSANRVDGISREYRINIVQGTTYVTDNPEAVLTTVLGSCVACCLFDPIKRIGGMNHFLLPEPGVGMACDSAEAERYGLLAMELLINGMLKQGAMRGDMRAHLYGGANMHSGMQAIGSNNAAFARKFLKDDGIALSHAHLGGTSARRIDFRAALGQARCRVVMDKVPTETNRVAPAAKGNGAEFFR